jgi:23S rRNA (pseudouridine1915-N3)-methyltransferase
MKVFLYKLGKPAFTESRDWVEIYSRRLRHQIHFETIEAKAKPKDPIAILRYAPSHEHRLIALDERGKQRTSEQLATTLSNWFGEPQIKSVSFLVGGPYGIPPQLTKAAHELWSLSQSTLPSDLAWLICAEQIFRAQSIRQGTGYHHGESMGSGTGQILQ